MGNHFAFVLMGVPGGMLSRPSRVLMRAKFVDWPRKHGTQLSPDPISTPPAPWTLEQWMEMDGVSCYARTLSSARSTVQGRWTVDARWTVEQPNRGCPYNRARVSGPRTWPDRKVCHAWAVSFQRARERGKVLNRKLVGQGPHCCCCCDSSSGWYGPKPFLPAISAARILGFPWVLYIRYGFRPS